MEINDYKMKRELEMVKGDGTAQLTAGQKRLPQMTEIIRNEQSPRRFPQLENGLGFVCRLN